MSQSDEKDANASMEAETKSTHNFDFLTDSSHLAQAIESFLLEEAQASPPQSPAVKEDAAPIPLNSQEEDFEAKFSRGLENAPLDSPFKEDLDMLPNVFNDNRIVHAAQPPDPPLVVQDAATVIEQELQVGGKECFCERLGVREDTIIFGRFRNNNCDLSIKGERRYVRQEVSVDTLFCSDSSGVMTGAMHTAEMDALEGKCNMLEIQVALLQAKLKKAAVSQTTRSTQYCIEGQSADEGNVALLAQQRKALEAISHEMSKATRMIDRLQARCQELEESKMAVEQLLQSREQQLEDSREQVLQLEARIREIQIPTSMTHELPNESAMLRTEDPPTHHTISSEAGLYASPGFAQGKVLSRLKVESSRLVSAEERIRMAQEKSQSGLAAAVSKLQALEQARLKAEARAAELEERVSIVNRSIDSIPAGFATIGPAYVKPGPKPNTPECLSKPKSLPETAPKAIEEKTSEKKPEDVPRLEPSTTKSMVEPSKPKPSYQEHLLEVARQDRIERIQKAREQRQRQNRSSWSLTDMQPPWEVVQKDENMVPRRSVKIAEIPNKTAPKGSRVDEKENREASAPFATDASSKRIDAGFSLLERKLLMTNVEIGDAEAKLGRLLNRKGRTRSSIEMRSELEQRLQDLRQQASNIRIALKSQPK